MSSPVTPIQSIQLTQSDLQDPSLGTLNSFLQQMTNAVNATSGAAGKTVLPAGVDVQGATVSNVGAPQSPTDAVSKGHADENYSASALAPQLEAGGSNTLKSFRSLNSKQQKEKYSSFLNNVMNVAPTTNTATVTGAAPVSGTVSFTVSAGNHQFVDGSIAPFGTFTGTVALPSSQAITSLTRTGGVVTATGTFTGLTAGESIYIANVGDTSFDGTFVLTSASGTTLVWPQPNNVNGTSTGGTVSTGGVYYNLLTYPSQQLSLSGPFPADTQSSRLAANTDGQVLIAVTTVSSTGVVATQSAAGATPPATTLGNRVVSRL